MSVHQDDVGSLLQRGGGELGPHAAEDFAAGGPITVDDASDAKFTGGIDDDHEIQGGIESAFKDQGCLHHNVRAPPIVAEATDLFP